MVHVSVIIATLNRKAHLANCIRSLLDQSCRDFEIIVVDGGSTDGTKELAKSLPVKYLRQSGKYIPNAENCGVRAAEGEILAFVDDDVIVSRMWLEQIVTTYDSHKVHGVGGRVISTQQPRQEHRASRYTRLLNKLFSIVVCENRCNTIGAILPSGEVLGNFDKFTSRCRRVDHLQGCNMSFLRSVFANIGPFDEVYDGTALRWETDFCVRARAEGFSLIYNPDAVVLHGESNHITIPIGNRFRTALLSNALNDTLFVLKRRRDIKDFSALKFAFRQTLIAERYLGLAIRRKNIGYVSGLIGMLKAFDSWISRRKQDCLYQASRTS
jgi:GT2 family glycosyltransferase